jgi:predicted CoA-binding protein
MTTTRDVQDFLGLYRIAMVGVSRYPKDFSRSLFREMCNRGYDVVPVNRVATEIDGRECFQCLQAIRPAVEGVLVMTPLETLRVAQDCAETGIRKCGSIRLAVRAR